MWHALTESMSLVDFSGYAIIAAIVLLLLAGVALTFWLRARYDGIARDLSRNAGAGPAFESQVLNFIVRSVQDALRRAPGDINTQAIVEQGFHAELSGLLIAERFLKAGPGLMIILGLVGTFYGLTLSIGRLVVLVSGDVAEATEITEALTRGLTQALSGMSVAFSTSLFGILAAIVMTLLGVFASVTDRRTALMVQIEALVDNVLLNAPGFGGAERGAPAGGPGGAGAIARLDALVGTFGESVTQLQATVAQFESALQAFSATTRDFREFNLHLKDNVQRMSLSFGDLSESLKDRVRELKARD